MRRKTKSTADSKAQKDNKAKPSRSESRISKEILVNAGDLETRVAILENGELAELYVEREPRIVGNIYKGKIVNVVRGMDAAFVDIGTLRNAFLSVDDVILDHDGEEVGPAAERRAASTIGEMLKGGQEVLLQVVRGPMGSKGPRVTTRLAIPGRYLVLLMGNGAYVGISRKIEKDTERQRLRSVAERIRPQNHGLIVRTEAEGKGIRLLKQDLEYLMQISQRIQAKAREVKAPALLHEDLPLISRVIRDTTSRQVKRIVVDSPQVHEDIAELIEMIAPALKQRVTLYRDKLPLFAAHGIDDEIERLMRRKVWLGTGGYLSVDETEALTTIDVNSGRYTSTSGLEETILRTNLQAADEVARQLRLRDLGGIIVIDFIDMDKAKHRTRVMDAFESALRRDRAKTKALHLSPLGLVEMTRKRSAGSLLKLLTQDCPCCQGTGRVRTALTVALGIEREIARRTVQERADAFIVHAHRDVVMILAGYAGERAAQTEKAVGRPIYIRIGTNPNVDHLEISATDTRQVVEQIEILKPADIVAAQMISQDAGELALAEAKGYLIGIETDKEITAAQVEVRIKEVHNSFARGQLAEKPAAKKPVRRRRPRRRPQAAPKSE
jgi:ribonuclease G